MRENVVVAVDSTALVDLPEVVVLPVVVVEDTSSPTGPVQQMDHP
jgi:hypothetical protein